MESGFRALFGFKCWRVAVNSLYEKVPELFKVRQRETFKVPPKVRHFLRDKLLRLVSQEVCEPRISHF